MAGKSGEQREELGLCKDLFVSSHPDGKTAVVGGTNEAGVKWTRVLSKRAAHLLWYRLTKLLFPDRAQTVTTMVSTAPLSIPEHTQSLTTHVEIEQTNSDQFTISGVVGQSRWVIKLTSLETRRLWTALDLTLYPDGWEAKPGETESKPARRRRQTYQ